MTDSFEIKPLQKQQGIGAIIQRRDFVFPGESWSVRRHGPDRVAGSGAVYVWKDMLEELIYASLRNPESLQAAMLVGHVVQSAAGRGVEVRGYLGLDQFEDLREFSEDTADSWEVTRNRVKRSANGFTCLGWTTLFSWPERGALTERERLTHRTFFNMPYQIYLRLCAGDDGVEIYGFDENGWLIQTGFNVVQRKRSPENPDS